MSIGASRIVEFKTRMDALRAMARFEKLTTRDDITYKMYYFRDKIHVTINSRDDGRILGYVPK